MTFKSLRLRIILTFTPVILLGFVGLTILVGNQIQASAEEDFAINAEEQAALVARGLSGPLEQIQDGEEPPSVLDDLLDLYVQQVGGDILLISANGDVVAGRASSLPSESFSGQAEFQSALNGEITHDIRPNGKNGELMLYTAAPVTHEGQLLAVVTLALPQSDVETTVRQRWLGLVAGIAALTGITFVVSVLLAISLTRPVEQLRQSALRLAEGDFSQNLPETRRDEIGALARAFNHMRRQLQAMLEEQRSFASNAAHELRTPLTTVLLRTEALLDDMSDRARTEQYVGEIHDEVERLSGLVDDLTLLSRFDANRFEPGKEQIEMERFAPQLSRQFETRFGSKSQRFELDVASPLNPLEVNLNHLRVVFRNLLDNAHKYTPQDGTIVWKVWQEGNQMVSAVTDSGVGMTPEMQANLFKRFYRGDVSHSRQVPGTGLGLALCKLIVEAYGGSLSVTSSGPGQGTVATVRWPTIKSEHGGEAMTTKSVSGETLGSQNVIVI